MTNEEAINYINSIKHMFENGIDLFENGIDRTTRNCTVLSGEALELYKKYIEACELVVQVMRTVDQKHTGEWIPVTTRPCTDEEFESMKELFGENIDREDFPFFDCPMPDDGQEILITTVWGVEKDTCEYDPDYGYTLEGRGDWEDVKAWMPSPEPYKKGGETNVTN